MEAQIERLKHENTLLRARLAEHGINGDISFDSAGPVSEPGEETEADESSGLSGKLVVSNRASAPYPTAMTTTEYSTNLLGRSMVWWSLPLQGSGGRRYCRNSSPGLSGS
ncbi:hypothetical protein DL93DRAFT_794429 [Clavulina sp. PMI_390]|nr:hypothetical protein DL93DRAFT_794429 [Clavulina sp. PMI_390]